MINIVLPFWLKWARKFMTLHMTEHSIGKLKGLKCDALLIDETVKLK